MISLTVINFRWPDQPAEQLCTFQNKQEQKPCSYRIEKSFVLVFDLFYCEEFSEFVNDGHIYNAWIFIKIVEYMNQTNSSFSTPGSLWLKQGQTGSKKAVSFSEISVWFHFCQLLEQIDVLLYKEIIWARYFMFENKQLELVRTIVLFHGKDDLWMGLIIVVGIAEDSDVQLFIIIFVEAEFFCGADIGAIGRVLLHALLELSCPFLDNCL